MARKLRVQYPGAIYHVMNRGDRREPIFKDDPDRQGSMKGKAERPRRTPLRKTDTAEAVLDKGNKNGRQMKRQLKRS